MSPNTLIAATFTATVLGMCFGVWLSTKLHEWKAEAEQEAYDRAIAEALQSDAEDWQA